jgi:hypothetical protein
MKVPFSLAASSSPAPPRRVLRDAGRALGAVAALCAFSSLALGAGACGGSPKTSEPGSAVALAEYPASKAMTEAFGIVTWKAYVGLHQVLVTGFDADGDAARGIQVAFFPAVTDVPAHVRILMLDGTGAAVRAVPGGASTGDLSSSQIEVARSTISDWESAASAAAARGDLQPGAGAVLGLSPACMLAVGVTENGAAMWRGLLACDPAAGSASVTAGTQPASVAATCAGGMTAYQAAMQACKESIASARSVGATAAASLRALSSGSGPSDKPTHASESSAASSSLLNEALSSGMCVSCGKGAGDISPSSSTGLPSLTITDGPTTKTDSNPSTSTSDQTDSMSKSNAEQLEHIQNASQGENTHDPSQSNPSYATKESRRRERVVNVPLVDGDRRSMGFAWHDAAGVAAPFDFAVTIGGNKLLQVFSVAARPYARVGLDSVALDADEAYTLVFGREGDTSSASIVRARDGEPIVGAHVVTARGDGAVGADIVFPDAFFRSAITGMAQR